MLAKLTSRLLAAAGLVCLTSGIAGAQINVLYYNDFEIATDNMAQALAGLGAGYNVTTATSDAQFQSLITTNPYGLVIYDVQGNPPVAASVLDLANYVSGGGHAIGADWDVGGGNTMPSVFGASFAGPENQTSVTVTSALLSGGITNPISLSNPGWGIFSYDLSGGTSGGTFGDGSEAIVFGNGGNTIFNGFLGDTAGGPGVQLYTNEIVALTSSPTGTPEPGAATLVLAGIVGSFTVLRRRRK